MTLADFYPHHKFDCPMLPNSKLNVTIHKYERSQRCKTNTSCFLNTGV